MTADPANGVQRQLGVLIGQMGGVIDRLDRADDSRARLHERVDMIAENVAETNAAVVQLQADVDAMKPEVEMVRHLKGKAAGAIVVLGAIGALAAWFAYAFMDQIKASIIRFFQ